MNGRVNPLGDLSDLAPGAQAGTKAPVPRSIVDQVAAATGFPSRQAVEVPAKKARRRRTTGRNQQFNIKASQQTIDRFYAMADAANVPLGELLERALDALEAGQGAK